MDSIIGGIEEVYRDNSRNGTSAHGILADNRCHNDNYGSRLASGLIKSKLTRLIRLPIRSLHWCSPPHHRSRVRYVPLLPSLIVLMNRGTLPPHPGDEVQEPKLKPCTSSYDIRNPRRIQGIIESLDARR